MKAVNDVRGYGWIARLFHWSIATLIFAAIGYGLYAVSLPQTGGDEATQHLFRTFSIHKTIGITILTLAVLRVVWTLTQTKPRPLHPDRRLETWLAETVHWGLYVGIVVMPLSGWLLHAAAPGAFSRILWPFGQRLPGIPESATLNEQFTAFHQFGWLVLAGLVLLHVAGALKHAVVDRDATLARMAGRSDNLPLPPANHHRALGALAALSGVLVWVGVGVASQLLVSKEDPVATVQTEAQPTETPDGSANAWVVETGTLGISVLQGGSAVRGTFQDWRAAIEFDPDTQQGHVDVTIGIASLTLGSVSDAAKGPDFLNSTEFPEARFVADILAPETEGSPHIARGELVIVGQTVPADLLFDLAIEDGQAVASGSMSVDRRDFGLGKSYGDETTVGFPVEISFDLTATRRD